MRRPQQPPPTPPPPELLSSNDLASLLGTTPRQIANMRARGQLPAPVKIAGLGLRWPRAVIEFWLAEQVEPMAMTLVTDIGGETPKSPRPRRRRSCDSTTGLTRGGETS